MVHYGLRSNAYSQARLSVAQWATLSEHCTEVKGRVASRPLPRVPVADGPPVLIPILISYITKGLFQYVLPSDLIRKHPNFLGLAKPVSIWGIMPRI